MKKIFTLLLISALLFSCSTDDGGETDSKKDILGKWVYVSQTYNGDKYTFTTDCEKGSYLEFFSDGIVNGKEMDSEEPCEYDEVSLSYTVAGDVLELTNPEGVRTSWDIVSFTENRLVLVEEYFDENYQETVNVRMELKK